MGKYNKYLHNGCFSVTMVILPVTNLSIKMFHRLFTQRSGFGVDFLTEELLGFMFTPVCESQMIAGPG